MNLKKCLAALVAVVLLLPLPVHAADATLSSYLTKPYVLSALIIVSVVAIVYGILTSDFSIAGIAVALSLGLFFYINFILLGRDMLLFVLFLAGLVLITMEIFIPGFGLPGITGIALLIFGIVRSFHSLQMAVTTLVIAALISIGLCYIIIKTGKNSSYIQRLVLTDSIQGSGTAEVYGVEKGMRAITLTDLKPSGYAQLNDEKIFVFSRDGFIERGKDIIVTDVIGSQIYVKEVENV